MPTTPTDIQLPGSLPVLPGLALSGRYLLTDVAPINRGDTIDAFGLPGGRVAAMVADVVGHGFAASVAAPQVRTVVRERLLAGTGIAETMRGLHILAADTAELSGTRVSVLVLDPEQSTAEYVVAGNPPPTLYSPRHSPRALDGSVARPLGVEGEISVATMCFDSDESVLLYTNGLTLSGAVPAADVGERFGTTLASVLSREAGPEGGDEACDRLISGLEPPSSFVDDAVLLLLRRAGRPPALTARLPVDPGSVGAVRNRLSGWLAEIGAGLADQIGLCHAAGEVTRNVVDHAYDDTARANKETFELRAIVDVEGIALVTIVDHGQWQPATERSDGGHGLVMASGLADELRISHGSDGTAVELRQRLRRPIPLLQVAGRASPEAIAADGDLETTASAGRLAVAGMVDELNVEVFRSALREATVAGTADAVIDLSRLTLLASPGVQAILDTQSRARRSGLEVSVVTGADTVAARVLDLVTVPHRDSGTRDVRTDRG